MHVKLLALLPAVLLETICFATTTAIAASTSPISHSTTTTAAASTSPNATSYREGRQGIKRQKAAGNPDSLSEYNHNNSTLTD